MKATLVNYNFTPVWLKESGLDYHILDRSDSKEWLKDFPQERITYTENVGQVDWDKLNYLVDHYDDLPDVFLWGKTNLFKYVSEPEWESMKDNKTFAPVLTQHHATYSDSIGPVCFYEGGIYKERNNSWYVDQFPSKYFTSFNDFAHDIGIKAPYYIPFAPGGNYILTKEVVHRYSRDLYAKMASYLPYCREPAEAQMAERSYYLLWR